MTDQEFATRIDEEKKASRSSYEFLEAAAFNSIADESNAKTRMADIERFTPAFPDSRFQESIATYAMMSLSELKDTARAISYGEKTLATNPNSLPTLLLMANTYSEDPQAGQRGQGRHLCPEGHRRGQSRRSGRRPFPQSVGWRGALHPGLRAHEAGQDGGGSSRL